MNEPEKNEKANGNSVEDVRLNDLNFQLVPNILVNDVKDGKITPLDVVVYMVFADHQRNKKHSWPSCQRIALVAGTSKRNVNRCIKRLDDAGHLTRHSKTRLGTKLTCLNTLVKGGKVVRTKGVQSDGVVDFPKPESIGEILDRTAEPTTEASLRTPFVEGIRDEPETREDEGEMEIPF